MAKHHRNPRLVVGLAAALIALGMVDRMAQADVFCRRAGIGDGNGRELFVAATARAKRIIGSETTRDPARLKAVITVDEGMLFVYSNFITSGFKYPTKIALDPPRGFAAGQRYDIEMLALEVVGDFVTGRAFGNMTFYLDEEVLDHPRFDRNGLAGAENVWIIGRDGQHRRWAEPVVRPAVPATPVISRNPESDTSSTYSPVTRTPWKGPGYEATPKPVQPLDLGRVKYRQTGLSGSSPSYTWPQDGQAIKMHLAYRSGNRLDVKADNDVRFPLWHFADETPELDLDQQRLLKYPWVISTEYYLGTADVNRLLLALRGLPVSFALTTQSNEGRALKRYYGRRDWRRLDVVVGEESTQKVQKHGRVTLDIVRNLVVGGPDGRRLTFLVWHQGLTDDNTLRDWLGQIRAGGFQDHHMVLLGCPPSRDGFFQLQHDAIRHGARSCVIPTQEVNLPAAALAAVTLSRYPELLDGATPLEALRRGYQAAAAPLAEALAITDDGLAIERLEVAFGERGVDFFRRGNGSFDRATARAILEGLRGDPAQFIECVDAGHSPDTSVQLARARESRPVSVSLRRAAA